MQNKVQTDMTADESEDSSYFEKPKMSKYSSFITPHNDPKMKPALTKSSSVIAESTENITQMQARSRKDAQPNQSRAAKRPISSYGTQKSTDKFNNKIPRMQSTSASRGQPQTTNSKDQKGFSSLSNENKNTSRYTPKSKDRRGDPQASFTSESNKKQYKSSMSFVGQETTSNPLVTGRNGNNSALGDFQESKIDEEEEKRLIHDNPMRKRVFLHIAQTSSSVQVAWSHSTKNITGKRIQYVLEYGVGIKMNGQEQFRTIYKGKAHKCIITDLMPRTAYRFKVVPFRVDDDGKEVFGETSDIKQINTFDNQDVNATTLGHHASILMKKQEKWVNFEKQGLIMATYGYSYGIQMWKITINCFNHYNLYNEEFTGTMQIGVRVLMSHSLGR